MLLLKALFWGSLGALAWTHVGYPATASLAARVRPRPVRKGGELPPVSVIVAAHDEEAVIERRLENLLALDYPAEKLEVVVASDASTDATEDMVARVAERDRRVRLVRCPRGGKVAAQDRAVRETNREMIAFSDANSTWAALALRRLVRNFADPDVAYVCGQLRLDEAEGTNREGAYWRYELGLREAESELHSVTGGNGSIYAVRRDDYVEVDPRFGHDLSFPYLMVQRGRRAVYEPEAIAFEKPTPDLEDEYRRKVRMFEHCWAIVLEGRMLRGLDPVYLAQLVSHRHLRYASGLLHLTALAANAALLGEGAAYRALFAAQLAFLGLAAARPGLPRYYVLVTWATVEALRGYLRAGVPAVWDKAAGDAVIEELACPRDHSPLEARGETLACAQGHEYPYVDGIAVLVVDDELEPTQPGYWSSSEQIERVRAAVPPPVEGDAVDPYVAELILGTHGNLYKDLSAGLSRYPIPDFPLPRGNGELLLDIGCNWGRWTIAAARAGYRPIGVDPSFEAIVAARRIARQLGVEASYVVADGRRLPFADGTFDVVFSYGVLQHFSKQDVATSVDEIRRVLKTDAYSWVQMPNALGALNVVRLAQRRFREGDLFEVRYWKPAELRRVFGRIGPTELSTDGFFTLNPQKRDLDLLPRRFRAVVRLSETLKRIHAPTTLADSVNVRSVPR